MIFKNCLFFPKFEESKKSFQNSCRTRKNISFMPETQIYYHEGASDYNYAGGTYNGFPVMREVESFAGYRTGVLSFVNYFNQWGPQRTAENSAGIIDRNVQLLAIPATIFPKRITSMSQIQPTSSPPTTQVTYLNPLNPSGTFQGDKFRWFGTLQQIRIPECLALREILGERNWLSGGYHVPSTTSEPADNGATVTDTLQRATLQSDRLVNRRIQGSQSSVMFDGTETPIMSNTFTPSPNNDQYTLQMSNQIVRANADPGYTIEWNGVSWDTVNDQSQVTTRTYSQINFPLLLSPQFKPWICFRLITLKFKVSMNEWFQMSGELPYRLNTLFWNKQDNSYNTETTINSQWDRSTRNSILAKPNPYGGTFKICKNKKIFVNPFKGKSITNWIYSKKRGKIINTKMWQPGQAPIAGVSDGGYAQYGYYSNGLYVSLLLAPMNLERDFDAFTANVLRRYFPVTNGSQSSMTKTGFSYQWDKVGDSTAPYQRRLLSQGIPGFPYWLNNHEIPYAIQLYNSNEILIKTQTKYCEY